MSDDDVKMEDGEQLKKKEKVLSMIGILLRTGVRRPSAQTTAIIEGFVTSIAACMDKVIMDEKTTMSKDDAVALVTGFGGTVKKRSADELLNYLLLHGERIIQACRNNIGIVGIVTCQDPPEELVASTFQILLDSVMPNVFELKASNIPSYVPGQVITFHRYNLSPL